MIQWGLLLISKLLTRSHGDPWEDDDSDRTVAHREQSNTKLIVLIPSSTEDIIEFISALNHRIPSTDTASADRTLKTKPAKPIAKANNLSSNHLTKVVSSASFIKALTSKVDVSLKILHGTSRCPTHPSRL